MRKSLLICVLLAAALVPCQAEDKKPSVQLNFGVYQSDKATAKITRDRIAAQ